MILFHVYPFVYWLCRLVPDARLLAAGSHLVWLNHTGPPGVMGRFDDGSPATTTPGTYFNVMTKKLKCVDSFLRSAKSNHFLKSCFRNRAATGYGTNAKINLGLISIKL
jgi:hypothetical protein